MIGNIGYSVSSWDPKYPQSYGKKILSSTPDKQFAIDVARTLSKLVYLNLKIRVVCNQTGEVVADFIAGSEVK